MLKEAGVKTSSKVSWKVYRGVRKASLRWKLDNMMRWSYLKPWLGIKIFGPLANAFGMMTAYSETTGILYKRDGRVIDYGVLGRRVITDAGVNYVVDDWDGGASDINILDFHGFGTGDTAAGTGDTDIQTEFTTEYATNNVRPSGTNSQPSANIFQSIGTFAPDATVVCEEHGILSSATVGSGTLWDRTVFGDINMVSGDSLQITYQLTFTAGG